MLDPGRPPRPASSSAPGCIPTHHLAEPRPPEPGLATGMHHPPTPHAGPLCAACFLIMASFLSQPGEHLAFLSLLFARMPGLRRSSFPSPALSVCSFSHHHRLGPHSLQSGLGQLFLTVTPSRCQSPVPSSSSHLLPDHASPLLRTFHDAPLPRGTEARAFSLPSRALHPTSHLSGLSCCCEPYPRRGCQGEPLAMLLHSSALWKAARREVGGEVLGEGGSALTPIPAEAF